MQKKGKSGERMFVEFVLYVMYGIWNPFIGFHMKHERGWWERSLRAQFNRAVVGFSRYFAPVWTIVWIATLFVLPLPLLCLWAIGVPVIGLVINLTIYAA